MYENHVKNLDNAIPPNGRIVSAYFDKDNFQAFCDFCKRDNCLLCVGNTWG
ncbi:hypothetical protein HRbin06_00586 [archaeon HR06]|nr:hypothetical protein HRbin06_00586 [archaeon HR06]